MTRARRGARTLGLLLTWIGGGIAVLLLFPIALWVFVACYFVVGGIDIGSGHIACRNQACLDEWTTLLAIGLGVAAVTVTLIVLVARSSTRSLVVATAIGVLATAAVEWSTVEVRSHDELGLLTHALLVVALAPASLALGSLLRLWARRPAEG